jgi:aldehyde dehydrogenase (NAD+)
MEDMAQAISIEMGAPIDFSRASQATSGTSAIKEFLRQLKKFEFEEQLDDSENRLLYEPKGVCALITPWNWPISQVALKVIPAIAAGCTMVLKPSELAPLDSMIFAEMLDEAGCPAGVFNLVNGDGAGVGSQLTAHPDVNMILLLAPLEPDRLSLIMRRTTLKELGLSLAAKEPT